MQPTPNDHIQDEKRAAYNRFVETGEGLCAYVDEVLDAYHEGKGIQYGKPTPITLGLARKMIWQEIHRRLDDLFYVVSSEAETVANHRNQGFSFRIRAESGKKILEALNFVASSQEGSGFYWFIRCQGERPDDPEAVAHVRITSISNSSVANYLQLINKIEAYDSENISIRDYELL